MEAQVENNAKTKQTKKQRNKEKKRKKRICAEFNH